ncbi:MAG: CHASE2 domain-containing protein [Acidobacteria bacterium]|nr:MAG: CHASE2 domain-containing protein [Acidobacteriota bacterium]
MLLSSTAALTALENSTYDWRLRLEADPAAARSDIVIVEINDSSLAALEPVFGRWPWPRAVHAAIIDFLTRAHAKVIAYDVLFLEPDSRGAFAIGGGTMTGSSSDAALAASIARAGNVVLLADATYDGLQSGADASALMPASLPGKTWRGRGLDRPALRLPAAPFSERAAAVGHNALVHHERDRGTVRAFEPFLQFGNGLTVPSLGLAAALMATGKSGDDIPRDGTRMLVNYRGPYQRASPKPGEGGLYHTESAFDVLLSEEKAAAGAVPPIDPEVFRDKVVFIGISAAGLHDVVVTPFSNSGSTPGVFLHAAVADDVMSGRYLRRAPAWSTWALTAVLGLGAGLIALSLTVWPALLTTAGGAAIYAVGLVIAFKRGWWVEAATPLTATAIAAFAGVTWNYFVEGRDRRRVTRLFGRYVPKAVFDQLQANPALAKLGGTRREMSVLFSDIRGFTAASEHAAPEAVVAQLNEYFSEMVRVLHAHNGTLDKFVGDMVMGLFGAPVEDPNHAQNAVNAGLAMVKALGDLNAKWKAEGLQPFEIGIGINSGEMIAGNIGSEAIMSYTVIGDAVNLASRLESLNKEFGTRIIISDATRQRLPRSMEMTPLGDVTVKGRAQKVAVFAVTCMALLALAAPAWAQLPGKLGSLAGKAQKAKEAVDSLVFTDEEEQALGKQVSDQLRLRFGVVQDKAVHKYVTLVGTVLAKASSRPALPWKFIVLDTDGVNAYAAPGGFIHITRGALSLLQNESELADMLGHEIAHVTEQHTIKAIRQGNAVKLGAEATRSQVLSAVADKSYQILYEGAYDRGQEIDADKTGVALANKAGYAPAGLSAFLARLDERNKDNPDRNGLFASHPATKERIDKIAKEISSQKLTASALVAARYKASISYKPVPLAAVAVTSDSKLGLSGMTALGGEKKSNSTIASAGARGGVQDRDAKGGPNSAVVTVAVTPTEIADFKKGIVG